jgi:hypothetical protein
MLIDAIGSKQVAARERATVRAMLAAQPRLIGARYGQLAVRPR